MLSNATRKWIRTGLEAFITGATSSVSAAVGVNVVDPGNWGATTKSLKLMGITALITGVFKFVTWWNAHPLPEEGDTTMTKSDGSSVTGKQVVSLNPLTTGIVTK